MLIIDDSRLVRGLLQATLSRFFRPRIVGEAGDGQRGEQLTRTLASDVTMDVLMPMMGGIRPSRSSCVTSRPHRGGR